MRCTARRRSSSQGIVAGKIWRCCPYRGARQQRSRLGPGGEGRPRRHPHPGDSTLLRGHIEDLKIRFLNLMALLRTRRASTASPTGAPITAT
jgi:hypothetical protein